MASDLEKTFYANQGGKEKTTLSPSLATLWSEGDAIKVYPETGGAGTDFTLADGAGTSFATFTGLTTLSDVYVAFYPAANAKSISGSTVTFNIPATQTVTEAGSFDTNTVPMVGYTTDNTLAMMNVGSLFELGLKAKTGTQKVVKIELKGNEEEYLAGDFTVDASVSGQPTATYSENGAKSLIINCGEYKSGEYQGIEINTSDYTKFYISIPAGVFTDGFTALITDSDGKMAAVKQTGDMHKGAAKIIQAQADVKFVVDACNNAYGLVSIGTQIWLKENMRCNKYDTESEAAGMILTTEPGEDSNYPFYIPTRSGDPVEYGYYYNMAAAMYGWNYEGSQQGICPNGFHVPYNAEMTALEKYLDDPERKPIPGPYPYPFMYTAGDHLKASSDDNPGWNGDNLSGFSALPAGYIDIYGEFQNDTRFWVPGETGVTLQVLYLFSTAPISYVSDFDYNSVNLCSVRCIMN